MLLARFLMDRDAYQAPSRSFNVQAIRSTQEWLGRPRLSWYYIAFADADAMAQPMEYIYFDRAPEADFEVGERSYAVFAHDWRRFGGADWLERMTERELGDEAPAPSPERRPEALLALSQAEFSDAVRRALRDLHRPDALATNPLTRTRVVRERRAELPAPEALRELLYEAVAALRADPRGEKLVRALERTYLRPAPDPGGRRRASRSALQHLPRPPDARPGARRGLALAARARRHRRVSEAPAQRY